MRACLALVTVIVGTFASICYGQAEGVEQGSAYACVSRLRPYVPPGFEIMAVNHGAMMINHHKTGRTFYFQRDSAVEIQGSKTTHIDVGTLRQVLRPPGGQSKVEMQLAIEDCGQTFNWMTDPAAKQQLEKAKVDEEAAAAALAAKQKEDRFRQRQAAMKRSVGHPKIALYNKQGAKKRNIAAVKSKKKIDKAKKSAKKEKNRKSDKKSAKKTSKSEKLVKASKSNSKNRKLASKYFEKPKTEKKSVAKGKAMKAKAVAPSKKTAKVEPKLKKANRKTASESAKKSSKKIEKSKKVEKSKKKKKTADE